VNKEELIKFRTSSASGSGSRTSRFLQLSSLRYRACCPVWRLPLEKTDRIL